MKYLVRQPKGKTRHLLREGGWKTICGLLIDEGDWVVEDPELPTCEECSKKEQRT